MIKFEVGETKFLAGKLQEFLSFKLESKIEITQRNYCYLLSQSWSVTLENFRKMLMCVMLLIDINKQSKSNNFSLYSFITTVYQESPFTNDPVSFSKR